MTWQLKYDPKFVRQINRLDKQNRIRVMVKVIELADNPLAGKGLKENLKNHRSLRVGDYRVLYCVDGIVVRLLKVEHRSIVYDVK